MKKNIFKKVVASLATVAMAAGLFTAMPTEETKAATNVKIYVKVDDVTNYGVNAWGGVKVTGGTNVNTWQNDDSSWQTHPSLISDDDGWGYVTLDDASKVSGMQVVKEKNALTVDGNNNIWNAEINAQNLTEAYFKDGKWYKEKACTTEIKPPVLDDIFYVLGDAGLTGADWGNGAEGVTPAAAKMTADGASFVKKFVNIEGGTYKFKILQDPADFGWDKVFTTDEKDDWGNSVVKFDKKSDVTITFNKDTQKVTVTVTEVQESSGGNTEGGNTEGGNTEGGNTTGGNTEGGNTEGGNTTGGSTEDGKTEDGKTEDGKTEDDKTEEKGVTVEVTLDPSIKWEEVYIHAWGEGFETKWPGVKMTAKDGKWYATLDTELAELNFVINAGEGKEQTTNIEKVSTKNAKITVTAEKNDKGHFVASAGTVAGGGSTNPGDMAPVVIMLAVAVVAAGMVVASKKKTICE